MPENSKQIALFGCGAWGRNIARVLAELKALAVICDCDEQRGAAIAGELGVDFTAKPATALQRAGIAGVAVATPAATHAEVALMALEAGKHVFIEKPIALSVPDARRIADKAAEMRRVLMIGHLLQYHPVFVKLLGMVRAGELGKVQYVYSNRLNQGRVRTEENALWSLAPHDFSMILAVAGAAPVRVRAAGQAAVQPEVPDLAVVDMAFANGVKAHIFCSWLNPYKEHRLAVVGDKAMAVFEDTAAAWEDKLVLYRHTVAWKNGVPEFVKGAGEKVEVAKGEPLRSELQHFLDCIAGKHPPRTDATEAIAVLEALAAAQRSMDGDET